MRKERVVVSINKNDGAIKFETHGVKGKACLDMLEELLGELVDVQDTELKPDYNDDGNMKVADAIKDHVELKGGKEE
jgi:hypothetical protein